MRKFFIGVLVNEFYNVYTGGHRFTSFYLQIFVDAAIKCRFDKNLVNQIHKCEFVNMIFGTFELYR
ncbi:MAG: hypothetical protein ABIO76_01780, partial [Ginsengibacter sp.]